jgi:hypothetical protein
VHDAGGAFRSAWVHGRDDALIQKIASRQAKKFRVNLLNGTLVAEAANDEWLTSAIIAVANASAMTAHLSSEWWRL